MGTIILEVLKKVSFKNWLIIIVILLLISNSLLLHWGQSQKKDKERIKGNYEAVRDLDSLKIATLKFNSKREVKAYLNSTKELKYLKEVIEEKNLKIKNLSKVTVMKQTQLVEVKETIDISPLVENIRENIPKRTPWVYSKDCLNLEGTITFEENDLSLEVSKWTYDNELVIIDEWKKPQRNIWTKIFGRKKLHLSITTKCGETKSIVINQRKNK